MPACSATRVHTAFSVEVLADRLYDGAAAPRTPLAKARPAEQRLDLQRDEELGNSQVVAQDYDVPAVTGTIELKPRDVTELLERVRQIAGVATADEVVGPSTTAVLPLEILLHSPDDGAVLKTLYVPDARFSLPGYSGQVQQKLTTTFSYESDGGILKAFKGAMT